MTDLFEPVPVLSAWHPRWKKNRDFTSSKDAIVKAGTTYLPKPISDMSDDEYREYIKEVSLFPACIKVLESWMGLVFREKPDLLNTSSTFGLIKKVITPLGDDLYEFAAAVTRETFITNWTGILADHPERPEGRALTAANAIENGFRPFLNMFPAESILDIHYGIVRNRQEFVYVRLLESKNSVLELRLTDGIYTIERHTRTNDGKQITSSGRKVPTRNGQPLTSIPFQIVTVRNAKVPTPSPFEHMVDLNCDIWVRSGRYAQSLRYCSNPLVAVSGVQQEVDENNNPTSREYKYGPGVIWDIDGEASIEVTEFTGTGTGRILEGIHELKSELARTGARILQDDKAAAEATETVIIRQIADNASLGGLVTTISRHLLKAIQTVDWWLGNDAIDEISFELNTDYVDNRLKPGDIEAALNLSMAGKLSDKEFFHILQRPGGFIDKAVKWEEHQAQLEASVVDTPIAITPAQTEE